MGQPMTDTFLRVHECFSSIQGESTYAGKPCFFIRLQGCNLTCGYCDTQKALDPSGACLLESVDSLVAKALDSGLSLVEITGGEPMMQGDSFCMLAERLVSARSFTILLETNGSFDLSYVPAELVRIIDFKTPSSGMSERMYLGNFRNIRRMDEVKFVLSDRNDYLFALEKIKEYDLFSQTSNVLLSPVPGRLDGAHLVSWMIQDRLNARMNVQIHKYFSGVQ